ncbi:MAG: aminoglycoside phosphotransferase family protein [Chloroflexota bacterium]
MSDAVVLKDEPGREVLRVGDTVRRRAGWWTPAVHALLRHLEATSFPYSPRAIGIDERGREVLTYMPGCSGADGWAHIVGEAGLARFARLLRAYHDAVRTFQPPADLAGACTDAALGEGEIVRHGDFGPWNVVWRHGHPVGILDWDFAGPGRAVDDIAYALEYAVPFRDDQTALRWLHYDRPPDRRRRIKLFAEAYGLAGMAGFVDQVARRQRLDIARVRTLAERGLEPQATWVATGVLDELEARASWTERHRSLFE